METYLNYDDQGFIIGTKRLESGIKSIGEDTQEIIQILKSQNQINQTTLNRIAKSNERIANKRTMRVQGAVPVYDPKKTSRPSTTASQPATSNTTSTNKSKITSNATVKAVEPTAKPGSSNSPDGLSRAGSKKTRGGNNPTGKNGHNKSHKERDESGRFKSKDKSLFDSLTKIANGSRTSGYNNYGGGNQDIDPLIASVTELKDTASPMINMAMQAGGMVGRSALKVGRFSFSKYKSLKRKEPLPKEQQRHNKQNEKTLGEILKRMGGGESSLLDSLGGRFGLFGGGRSKGRKKGKGVKAILSGAGASVLGAGKHGGKRIGKVAKALGKTRVIAPLATAIGVGSLASQWGDMDHKQKSAGVGSLAGGGAGSVIGGAIGTALIPVPAVGTAVGAAVGGWIGSEGGEVLGGIASPYIKSWTDSVKAYNLPKKMEGAWRTGLIPILSGLGSLADRMGGWVNQKIASASDTLGNVQSVAGAIADAAGLGGLGSVAAKYESSGRGVGTISTGAGDHGGVSYGVHQLASNNGSMNAYLKSEEGRPFAKYFAGTKPGTKAFNDKYKQVVNSHGEAFKKSQHAYITRTHYMPAKSIAEKYGFDTTNRGIQEAIYSHATQYGANHTSRFKRIAKSGVNMKDNEAVLKALYADKYNRVDSDFKSSSRAVRDGVRKRIKREQADVLALSKVSIAKKEVKNKIDKTKENVAGAVDGAKETVKETVDRTKETVKETVSAVTDVANPPNGGSKPILPKNHQLKQLGKTAKEPPNFTENIRSILNGNEPVGVKSMESAKNKFMPATAVSGLSLPAMSISKVVNIPEMPSFKIPLAGGGRDRPIVVQPNNETIGQNVSDRDLAHAITGGIGMMRGWD